MTLPLVSTFDAFPGAGVTESLPRAAAANFPDEWFYDMTLGSGRMSTAGVRVTPEQALGHAPFWQGVNIIAGDLGQLPVRVQRRETGEGGRDQWRDDHEHQIDWLLNHRPNDFQSPSVFKETLILWALLHGNGCALPVWRGDTVEELLPLMPTGLTHQRVGHEHRILYTTTEGARFVFEPGELLHVRGLATDGFWGRSAVDVARNVFGMGIAARDHAAATLKNGGRPSGIVKTDVEVIKNEARTQLREEWRQVHGGAGGAGNIAVLGSGWDYQSIAMSNADAQLMELMRLDREQVASLLMLPAFKLNALENAAVRANVAESNRAYYATTLSRWCVRLCETLHGVLVSRADREARRYRVRLDAESLTAGNPDDRANRASKLVRARLANRNEGRELVDLNPVPGGDEFENPAIDTNKAGSDDDRTANTEESVENLQAEVENLKRTIGAMSAALSPSE